MSNLEGQTVGRYRVLQQVGQGGMATVYKAYDPNLDCEVALKVIRRERLTPEFEDQSLKRFRIEAQKTAQLNHPNIVPVTDYDVYEGAPYLVMKFLPGALRQRMGTPMPWAESARLLAPIARALEHSHHRGIVHRDIKPGNILLTETGGPMLSDFGIAKLLSTDETRDMTRTGTIVGTPEYMAPEQGLGQAADHRSDIYSLGVVFYELVTGRKPFIADTPMAVLLMHVRDPLPSPRKLVPGLPAQVEKVLYKALAKEPRARYQTMGELADALEALTEARPERQDWVKPALAVLLFVAILVMLKPVGAAAAVWLQAQSQGAIRAAESAVAQYATARANSRATRNAQATHDSGAETAVAQASTSAWSSTRTAQAEATSAWATRDYSLAATARPLTQAAQSLAQTAQPLTSTAEAARDSTSTARAYISPTVRAPTATPSPRPTLTPSRTPTPGRTSTATPGRTLAPSPTRTVSAGGAPSPTVPPPPPTGLTLVSPKITNCQQAGLQVTFRWTYAQHPLPPGWTFRVTHYYSEIVNGNAVAYEKSAQTADLSLTFNLNDAWFYGPREGYRGWWRVDVLNDRGERVDFKQHDPPPPC